MEGAVEQPLPPIPLTPSNSMSAGPFALSRHARLAAGDVDVVTTSRWYFYTGPMPAPETPDDECRVFSGTANPELSAELASFLGRPSSRGRRLRAPARRRAGRCAASSTA